MSAAVPAPARQGAAPGRPRPGTRTSAARRPALSVVPARRPVAALGALGRTPFVVLVVGLLAAGLLGLLALNTALAQDAFTLHNLKQDRRDLEDREQVLQREVEALRAPQALASAAASLGMVPAGPPAFLRLADGAVLGATEPPADPADPSADPAADPAAPPGPAGVEIAGLTESSSATAPESPAPESPAPADVEAEEGR